MKKLHVLVVCAKNEWRSPTAEVMYRQDPRVEVRSAGTSPRARHQVSERDISWADHILVMESRHQQQLSLLFPKLLPPPITVAQIDKSYPFMDPELIELLRQEIELLIDGFFKDAE